MEQDTRLLIIDDDPEIASALVRGLALHGYDAIAETQAGRALNALANGAYRAAIVDVMLGPDSGIDLVRKARAKGVVIPIVMLSALSDVEHRAAGLEAGADDYIVKPFSLDELAARLKVQEHRAQTQRPAPARLSDETREIQGSNRSVTLTEREYELLCFLARHNGEPQSRGTIFDSLWAVDGSGSENVVDVYLGYLRRKLEPASDFGFEIKTIRNKGFCLEGISPRKG